MADDDIEAMIAAAPSAAGATDTSKQRYIGVPDNYTATRTDVGTAGSASHFAAREHGDNTRLYTGNAQPLQVTPRYATGSEYRMRSLSPERIAALQSTLVSAGLIGKKQTFRIGVWDEVSASAYRKVLAYANQGGIDEDTALSELQYNGLGGLAGPGDQTPIKQGRVQTVTPATTLEQQVQQTAQDRLGRKLRKDEVTKFVTLYGGIEKSYNANERAAADAADQGTDTTLTAPPSVDAAATQFMDSKYATEAAGQDTLGYLGALQQLVGGQ